MISTVRRKVVAIPQRASTTSFPTDPPSPVFRGNTLFVSSLGTDATAAREDFVFHYNTIKAACAASQSGDNIIVSCGNYDEQLKDTDLHNRFLHLLPGVILNCTEATTLLLDNTDIPVNINITGHGTLKCGKDATPVLSSYPAMGGIVNLEFIEVEHNTAGTGIELYLAKTNLNVHSSILFSGLSNGMTLSDADLLSSNIIVRCPYIGDDLTTGRVADGGNSLLSIIQVSLGVPFSSVHIHCQRLVGAIMGHTLRINKANGGNNTVYVSGGTIENHYNGSDHLYVPDWSYQVYGACIFDSMDYNSGTVVTINSDCLSPGECDGIHLFHNSVTTIPDITSTINYNGAVTTSPDGNDTTGIPIVGRGNVANKINFNGHIKGYGDYVAVIGYYDGSPSANLSKSTPFFFNGRIDNLGAGSGIFIDPYIPDVPSGCRVFLNCPIYCANEIMFSVISASPVIIYNLSMQSNVQLGPDVTEEISASVWNSNLV